MSKRAHNNQRLIASLFHAFEGIAWMLRNERNAPLHLAHVLALIVMSLFLRLSTLEAAIVLLAATQAFALECVNSAVEKTCDRIGSEKNELVKISKDAASAAVLLSVIVSLALDTMIVVARLIGCM